MTNMVVAMITYADTHDDCNLMYKEDWGVIDVCILFDGHHMFHPDHDYDK